MGQGVRGADRVAGQELDDALRQGGRGQSIPRQPTRRRPHLLRGAPRRCQSRPRPVRDHGVREPHAGRRTLLTAPATEVRALEQLLRIAVGGHGLHDRAAALQAPGPDQGQPRVVDPGVGRGRPPVHRQRCTGVLQHPRHRREVVGHRVGTQCLARLPVRLQQPRAGGVQLPRCPGTALVDEQALEQGLQDLVVAVRATALGQRGEELARGEVLQDPGAALPLQECVAQRPGQRAQGARGEEELTALGVELVQDGPGQVAAQQPGPPVQVGHCPLPLDRRLPRGGEVEEHQPCRPAAGAPGEGGGTLGGQGLAVHAPEELLDLPRAEPQRLAVELDQLTGDHQPRRVAGERAAGAESQPDLGRAAAHQRGQLVLGGRAGELVDVVEDQQEGAVRDGLQDGGQPAPVPGAPRSRSSA